jgi:uncharacterized protein
MNSDKLSLIVSEKADGCILKCWIQPRSSRNAVVGVHGDAIKIALTAPPVDGKANKELLKFLAKYFKLPKSSIQIIAGDSSRSKTILIVDIKKDVIIKKLSSK